jgi:hypothetical protein
VRGCAAVVPELGGAPAGLNLRCVFAPTVMGCASGKWSNLCNECDECNECNECNATRCANDAVIE